MSEDRQNKIAGTSPAGDAFRAVHITANDGLRLYARDYGPDPGFADGRMPLVCLPGLTRNTRDFHDFALIMSGAEDGVGANARRRVIGIDSRGRGGSERDPDASNYNLMTEADDVLAVLSALDVRQAIFIGTSRGGLITHVLAATRPTVIGAVVLNDIGPVIESSGLAEIRDYLTGLPQPENWNHARDLIRQVHGESFTALTEHDWVRMAEAIYTEENGRIFADYDPAIAHQLDDIDYSTALPTLWPQFEAMRSMPVMAIRGANSKLLASQTLAEMEKRHPGLTLVTVEGQGHAPLLNTAGLPGKIMSFLKEAGI